MHYKKDGTHDMRYSSSRVAASSSAFASSSRNEAAPAYDYAIPFAPFRSTRNQSQRSEQSFYKSNLADALRTSAADAFAPRTLSSLFNMGAIPEDLHYKKDFTPDMRYSSSKRFAEQFGKLHIESNTRMLSTLDPSRKCQFERKGNTSIFFSVSLFPFSFLSFYPTMNKTEQIRILSSQNPVPGWEFEYFQL